MTPSVVLTISNWTWLFTAASIACKAEANWFPGSVWGFVALLSTPWVLPASAFCVTCWIVSSTTGDANTDWIKAVFVNSIFKIDAAFLGTESVKVPFTVTLLEILLVPSIEVI